MNFKVSYNPLYALFVFILVYISYALGGIYYFYQDIGLKSVHFSAIILLSIYFKRFFEIRFFYLSFVIGMFFIIQSLKFGSGTFYNFLGLIVVFGTPYLLYRIFYSKLIDYYIVMVTIFAIVSLVFWFSVNLSSNFFIQTQTWPELLGFDKWLNQSYLIFSTRDNRSIFNIIRNNGGFWEPGAYSTTLVLTLLLNVLKKGEIGNWVNIILTLAIISTFSTAGYVALFFIYILHFNLKNPSSPFNMRHLMLKKILAFVIIGFLIISIDFLGEKTYQQFSAASAANLSEPTSGRFIGARKSINGILKDPLFGKYIVQERTNFEELLIRDDLGMYGFFYLIQRIGILGFCIFIYFIYKGFLKIFFYYDNWYKPRGSAFIMLIIWMSVMFAQNLYWTPLSLLFFWIGVMNYSELFENKKTMISVYNSRRQDFRLYK